MELLAVMFCSLGNGLAPFGVLSACTLTTPIVYCYYDCASLFSPLVDFHSDIILLSAIATLSTNQGLFIILKSWCTAVCSVLLINNFRNVMGVYHRVMA